ncbi:MAG TPA: acyltransferase [Roseiarcus sp.]|jgi:acetyltransferase-like isoleucine patch superfamily enzyme|nr:acyltransferase [Roseiarcus sp.]
MLSDLRSTGVLAVIRREIRPFSAELRRLYFVHVWGMDIGPGCAISFSAKLDKSYPRGIHIGEGTAINFGACILTHDTPRGVHADTWIGKDCNIGANSLIMPGIRVGDNCVVAAASVVMKDVPSNSLVAGNPARIMEKGIKTRRLGIIDRTVRPDFGAAPPVSDEAAPEKAAS